VRKNYLNVLIAQKNPELAKKLKKYIQQYDNSINVVGNLSTLEQLHKYIQEKDKLDIAIFETRLSDGPTFDLLKKERIHKPIVFTSSNQKDAFKAFKVNGVDYLLEPFLFDDFASAMEKAIRQTKSLHDFRSSPANYKKRFLVKIGDKLKSKNVEDISYIFAEGKTVYIVSKTDNRKYIIEYTLDELERIYLNPNDYYRVNRKFIVNINAIEEVRNYVNSRLKLILNPSSEMDMIVSREKVIDFKNWLNL
jgi:DNA-binding LytR/AlgR family response regulator